MNDSGSSDKSRGIALALGIPLGVFGAHRFYVGKVGTGLLQLCTLGGCGLWWLYDMILIFTGAFTDAEGRRVVKWDLEESEVYTDNLRAEVEALRSEVAELHERVDFTERLLAQPRAEQESRRV